MLYKLISIILTVTIAVTQFAPNAEALRPTATACAKAGDAAFWRSFWQPKEEGQGAFQGEYPKEVTGFILDVLKALLHAKQGAKIIDIGSGADMWVLRQIENALLDVELYGLDILDKADIDRSAAGRIRYRQASASNTGFGEKFFDVAISTFTADYLDRKLAAIEILRILNDNGRAIFVFHHPESNIIPAFRVKELALDSNKMSLLQIRKFIEDGDYQAINQHIEHIEANFRAALVPSREEKEEELKILYEALKIEQQPGVHNKLIERIDKDIAEIEDDLAPIACLLKNLFMSTEEIVDFFGSVGFKARVEILREDKGIPIGYGVIAEKADSTKSSSAGTDNRNRYYLISGGPSDLQSLCDKLPQSLKQKVVARVRPPFIVAPLGKLITPRFEKAITNYFKKHIRKAKDAGAVPILIGGLHILSYWFYIALKEVYGVEANIVSLDRDSDMMGYELSDTEFWPYGIKKSEIDPKKLTILGIRVPPHEAGKWAHAQGVTFIDSPVLLTNIRFGDLFISLDTDVYGVFKPDQMEEIACRLGNNNVLGIHIANLEHNYISGLRDSELKFIGGMFPQAFDYAMAKKKIKVINDEGIHIAFHMSLSSLAHSLFNKYKVRMWMSRADDPDRVIWAPDHMEALSLILGPGSEVIIELQGKYPEHILKAALDVFDSWFMDVKATTAGCSNAGHYMQQIYEKFEAYNRKDAYLKGVVSGIDAAA